MLSCTNLRFKGIKSSINSLKIYESLIKQSKRVHWKVTLEDSLVYSFFSLLSMFDDLKQLARKGHNCG